MARAKEGPRVRNDGEAVPEIRVREKKKAVEVNEHDEEVRIAGQARL